MKTGPKEKSSRGVKKNSFRSNNGMACF